QPQFATIFCAMEKDKVFLMTVTNLHRCCRADLRAGLRVNPRSAFNRNPPFRKLSSPAEQRDGAAREGMTIVHMTAHARGPILTGTVARSMQSARRRVQTMPSPDRPARRAFDPRLLEGSISRSLFLLAVPIMGANILQVAYQIVDAFWVGRLGASAVA